MFCPDAISDERLGIDIEWTLFHNRSQKEKKNIMKMNDIQADHFSSPNHIMAPLLIKRQ